MIYNKKGRVLVIYYKINVLSELKEIGYTTYKLRKEKIFGERTIQKLRDNDYINFNNLDIICKLLNRQPSEIIGHRKDN